MDEIRIEVDQESLEEAKKSLASLGISIDDGMAKFFEHMVADKERILKDFRAGIPAEELVARVARETIEIKCREAENVCCIEGDPQVGSVPTSPGLTNAELEEAGDLTNIEQVEWEPDELADAERDFTGMLLLKSSQSAP